MRKQNMYAVIFAGVLAAALAGCGNGVQAPGKEGCMPLNITKAAEEAISTAKKDGAIQETILLGTALVSVGATEVRMEQVVEEKREDGLEQENGAALLPDPDGQSRQAGEQEPEGSRTDARITEPEGSQADVPPPEQAQSPASAEAPAPKPAETPASKPAEAPEPEPEPEPPAPKSIYDYEFDIEAVRQELISLGEGMGLTHITTDDGRAVTPDNASWTAPVTASESFQGDNLKRKLADYVQSMPGMAAAYGGNPIGYFTIYIEPLGGGSYRIYFLY